MDSVIRAALIHHDGATEDIGLFATLDDVAVALGLSDWSEQAAASGYSRGDVLAAWSESGVFRQEPFGNDLGLLLVPGACAHSDTVAAADSLSVLDNEDDAEAGAAGLLVCVDCGAVIAPESEGR